MQRKYKQGVDSKLRFSYCACMPASSLDQRLQHLGGRSAVHSVCAWIMMAVESFMLMMRSQHKACRAQEPLVTQGIACVVLNKPHERW